MTRPQIAALLVASFLALPAPARAQPAGTVQDFGAAIKARLDRGRAQFADLDYRATIQTLAPVPTDPAATSAERLRALELIGLSHLILGHKVAAERAFKDLLAIDPGYQLRDDSGSPKIRDFFDRVKREYVPGFDPNRVAELVHSAPTSGVAGHRVELSVEAMVGAGKVKEMVVSWRQRGVLSYRQEVMRRVGGHTWRASFVPAPSAVSTTIEYYIEARDLTGNAIGRVGGPKTPLGLPILAGGQKRGGDRPWYGRWYVIAGGALALGAGAAALYFGTRADSVPPGSLGTVTLTP
ncbi:MAG TPA: hypothetical protein VFG83_08490 [Kofleriaceae bacterium]|nr:hypothetical protein [Kofleriaceae bacterium]